MSGFDENIQTVPILVDGPPAAQTLLHLDSPARVRRETLRQILRSKTFIVGAVMTLFWIACAVFGHWIAPYDPIDDSFAPSYQAPSWAHPMGLDRVGRDVFSRVIVGARSVIIVAPAAIALGVTLGSMLGLVMGYFRGLGRQRARPYPRRGPRHSVDRARDPPAHGAVGGQEGINVTSWQLIIVIGIAFTPPRRPHGALRRARRARPRLRAGGEAPRRARALRHVRGDPPERDGADHRRGDRPARLRGLHVATLAFLGYGAQPPSPDWGLQIAEQYADISLAWWAVIFPALAIASLVVAINLIADAVQQVVEQ